MRTWLSSGIVLLLALSHAPALVCAEAQGNVLAPGERLTHDALYARCGVCMVRPTDGSAERARRQLSGSEASRSVPFKGLDAGAPRAVAIVVGEVRQIEGLSTTDGHAYTAYRVRVDRVIKASAVRDIVVGAEIVATRPGGTVTWEGLEQQVDVPGVGALVQGQTLRVAVAPVAGTSTFIEVAVKGEILSSDEVLR